MRLVNGIVGCSATEQQKDLPGVAACGADVSRRTASARPCTTACCNAKHAVHPHVLLPHNQSLYTPFPNPTCALPTHQQPTPHTAQACVPIHWAMRPMAHVQPPAGHSHQAINAGSHYAAGRVNHSTLPACTDSHPAGLQRLPTTSCHTGDRLASSASDSSRVVRAVSSSLFTAR